MRRRRLFHYGLVVALLVILGAACGHDKPVAQTVAGNCLRNPEAGDPSPPPHITGPEISYQDAIVTFCTDSRSFAKIVKMATNASGCAPDSDGTFDGAGTACVRNLQPPHEGDPGNGGGLLSVGDCLQVDINDDGHSLNLWDYHEIGCFQTATEGNALVKIVKNVRSLAACRKPLLAFARTAPGIPTHDVADDQPTEDWPSVYGPVFCVQRL